MLKPQSCEGLAVSRILVDKVTFDIGGQSCFAQPHKILATLTGIPADAIYP